MNCNWVREKLSNYVDRMLDERSLEAVESHIHECESCKAELALLKKMLATMTNVGELEPPRGLRTAIKNAVSSAAREECERVEMLLSEYIDGTLHDAERSLVEKHLAVCLDCSYQFAALTNAVGIGQSIEQSDLIPNLRGRTLAAETSVARGLLGRTFDRVGEFLKPASVRWATAGIAAVAIAAAIVMPFTFGGKTPEPLTAKNPVKVDVRETASRPPSAIAKTPVSPVDRATAQTERPVTRIASAAKARGEGVQSTPKTKGNYKVIAKLPTAVGKPISSSVPPKPDESASAGAKLAPQKSQEVIAEQVKETVAKINTEIATEIAKGQKEEPKILKIAVVRQKPTDQVFTFEDLKTQIAKQRKIEQKSSVTIIGSKF